MKIAILEDALGWRIEPQNHEEHKAMVKEIEALCNRYSTTAQLSTAGSVWAEMPELARVQSEAGWPPLVPPSRECGWPQAIEPYSNSHDTEGDHENC